MGILYFFESINMAIILIPNMIMLIINLFLKNKKSNSFLNLIFIVSLISMFCSITLAFISSYIKIFTIGIEYSILKETFLHIGIIFIESIFAYIWIFKLVTSLIGSIVIIAYLYGYKNKIIIKEKLLTKEVLNVKFSKRDIITYFTLFIETKICIEEYNDNILLSEKAYKQYTKMNCNGDDYYGK